MKRAVSWVPWLAALASSQLTSAQAQNCVFPGSGPSELFLGEPVRFQLYAYSPSSGASFTWSVVPRLGNLPAGVSLSSGGLLTGAPSVEGRYEFTLRVSTSGDCFATLLVAGRVIRRLTIVSDSVLPEGKTGSPYAYQLAATGSGGIASPQFSWSASGLPKALSLDPVTGRLAGTPATAGLFRVLFRVEQRITENGKPATAASGFRLVNLVVAPGSGAPFTLNPLQLRYNFGPLAAAGASQVLTVTAPPPGTSIRALPCRVFGRLGPLGYPIISVAPTGSAAAPRFSVSVRFEKSRDPNNNCVYDDIQVGDATLLAADGDEPEPVNELLGEIRVFSERDPVAPPSGPKAAPVRLGSIYDPEFTILVVLSYAEGPALIVPNRITLRLNREGGPLPTKLVPIVSRQFGNERNFRVLPRTITPSNQTWLSVANLGTTPAALEVSATEAARRLSPGSYLAILEVTPNGAILRQSAKDEAGRKFADADLPVQKIPIVLIVGPDIPFQFSPAKHVLTNPADGEKKIATQAPRREAELVMQSRVEIIAGPSGLMSTKQNFALKDGMLFETRKPAEDGSYRAMIAAEKAPDYFAVLEIEIVVSDGKPAVAVSAPAEISSAEGGAASAEGSVTSDEAGPIGGATAPERAGPSEEALLTLSQSSRGREANGGVSFEARAESVGGWLSVESTLRVTPARLKLTADPRGLKGANHAGLLVIESAGTRNPVEAIPIALRIRAGTSGSPAAPSGLVGARFANGDGWSSRLVLFNSTSQPVFAQISFRQSNVSSSFPFPGFVFAELADRGFVRDLTQTLGPFSSLVLTTQGGGAVNGWVQVKGEGLGGHVLLMRTTAGVRSETATALAAGLPSGSVLPFDNRGAETLFSIANPTVVQGRFVLTARDEKGAVMSRTDTQAILPESARAVPLADLLRTTALAGKTGTLELLSLGIDVTDTPSSQSPISDGPPLPVVLLRQTEGGAINALPQLPLGNLDGAQAVRVLPYVAYGGGWNTRISLFNADLAINPALLRFNNAAGEPLALAVAGTARSSVSAFIDGLGAYSFQADRLPPALTPGWAELLVSPGIGAHANLSFTGADRTAEASIPLEPSPRRRLLVPFDNTDGYDTHLILVNTDFGTAGAGVAIYDRSGARLDDPGRRKVEVGRRSELLLRTALPETAARTGLVELNFSAGAVVAVALRLKDGGLSTVVPIY